MVDRQIKARAETIYDWLSIAVSILNGDEKGSHEKMASAVRLSAEFSEDLLGIISIVEEEERSDQIIDLESITVYQKLLKAMSGVGNKEVTFNGNVAHIDELGTLVVRSGIDDRTLFRAHSKSGVHCFVSGNWVNSIPE